MADSMKQYILMHKNIPVADIELDQASCAISAIGQVYAAYHVPVGIPVKRGTIDRSALNEWWKGRAIPASRVGIQSVLAELNLTTTQKLLEKDYPYSVCEDFITPQTDLISAWYMMQTIKKSNHVSIYQHYLDCCEAAGIPAIARVMCRKILLTVVCRMRK